MGSKKPSALIFVGLLLAATNSEAAWANWNEQQVLVFLNTYRYLT